MKIQMMLLNIIISCLCISCSHYPTPYLTANGGSAYTTQVGGKWMHTINADGSMSFTGDNEISLQHFFQTATSLGLSYIDMLRYAEKQLTQRFLQQQITRRQFNAGLFQLKELGVKAGITSEGIGAGAPLGPILFDPLP